MKAREYKKRNEVIRLPMPSTHFEVIEGSLKNGDYIYSTTLMFGENKASWYHSDVVNGYAGRNVKDFIGVHRFSRQK